MLEILPCSAYLICQTFMKSYQKRSFWNFKSFAFVSLQKCATLAHSCSAALRGLSECNERMSPGFSQVLKRSDKKLNGNDGKDFYIATLSKSLKTHSSSHFAGKGVVV